MEDIRAGPTTLTTSRLPTSTLLNTIVDSAQDGVQALMMASRDTQYHAPASTSMRVQRTNDSTINGVVIGLLSSFGSALVIAIVFLIVYFFRYTSSGRIFLDRIGKPGEYDDEQAYAREEAEALETMDDLQRTEYFRAKGMIAYIGELGWRY
jgi:hypothetical protein